MKYADLDNEKYDWLQFAIQHHEWVMVPAGKNCYGTIQAAGLFIKNGILGVVSIQGEKYYYPKECHPADRGKLLIKKE
jgi:hypothetical protein